MQVWYHCISLFTSPDIEKQYPGKIKNPVNRKGIHSKIKIGLPFRAHSGLNNPVSKRLIISR